MDLNISGLAFQPVAAAGSSPLGLAPTLTQANAFFLTQWGPTPWNDAAQPDGPDDCGPTSALMILSALGATRRPDSAQAEADITAMRLIMHPGSAQSMSTNSAQLVSGLSAFGVQGDKIPTTLQSVDAALQRGHGVLLAGDPKRAWGLGLKAQGNYLGGWGLQKTWGHWIAILGKNNRGSYVVGDPLSKVGAIAVTPAALRTYISDGVLGGWTVAVEAFR